MPTTVTVIEEDPEDHWDLADWLERMADAAPGGPTVFGAAQQSASLVIRVAAERPGGLPGRVRSCAQQVLGWSLANFTTHGLDRPAVPIQHPKWPQLWADAVSVQEVGPFANAATLAPGIPLFPGSKPGTFKPKAAGVSYEFTEGGVTKRLGPEFTANYGSADITVQFRNYPWEVYTDDDDVWVILSPGEEWRRMCCMTEHRPRLDLITAEGTETSKFYFAEKDAATGLPNIGDGTAPGRQFEGGVYVRKQQSGYTVCWKQVEEQYLIGRYPTQVSDGLVMPRPRRLDRYLGTVNSKEIWGQPKNTLLFVGYSTARYPQPVRTDQRFGLIAHDVYLQFDHFDPRRPPSVRDFANANIPEATRKRGHQLVPYREDPKKYWYAASAGETPALQGTYDGAFPFEELDFRDLFRHIDDPVFPVPS